MMDVGYDAFDDPYCYKGTGTLRNKAACEGAAFELEMTTYGPTRRCRHCGHGYTELAFLFHRLTL
jgi:hypothetical protein